LLLGHLELLVGLGVAAGTGHSTEAIQGVPGVAMTPIARCRRRGGGRGFKDIFQGVGGAILAGKLRGAIVQEGIRAARRVGSGHSILDAAAAAAAAVGKEPQIGVRLVLARRDGGHLKR